MTTPDLSFNSTLKKDQIIVQLDSNCGSNKTWNLWSKDLTIWPVTYTWTYPTSRTCLAINLNSQTMGQRQGDFG